VLFLTACATVKPGAMAPGTHAEPQASRILATSRQLDELETVDLLLTVDNDIIAPYLRNRLINGLARIPGWSGDTVNLTFLSGYIALDIQGSYELTPQNPTSVSLSGELVPYFEPGSLAWQTSLHTLHAPGVAQPTESAGETARVLASDAPANLEAVRDRLEQQLREAMSSTAGDNFLINTMPLGVLEAGIRLRSPFELVQKESGTLAGILTVAGSATLVDPGQTRFALDLGFVATPPGCKPMVDIGRATFAREVRNREPVDTAVGRATSDHAQVFFTDVLNADSPTTVIHYWFADGRPVSISELSVEPSARWRTWSAPPDELTPVSHWQVLVLEKRSGCVLAQRSLQIERPPSSSDVVRNGADAFGKLVQKFAGRTGSLNQALNGDDVAVVAITRPFFAQSLSEAMADLRLVSTPQVNEGASLPISASIAAVPAETLSCNREDCDSARVCTLKFDNCPVQRDVRDCSSCLLRNPLNNRCIREAEDPICLATRDAENIRLEDNREACIARETRLRDNCLLVRELEQERCSAQASLESSSCAARIQAMAARFKSRNPLAEIQGQATLSGAMRFEFREFRLDADLQRVSMVLSLDADLLANGQLSFKPAPDLNTLSQCLQATSDEFSTSIPLPAWQGGLVTGVTTGSSALTAQWSGLIQRLVANPSPVTQFFASHRDAISSCDIGLSADLLLNNLIGPGTDLLRGILDLDMQPEPTQVTLLPATLHIDGNAWEGNATIAGQSVSYRLRSAAGGQTDPDHQAFKN